jgi:hypothetical protein
MESICFTLDGAGAQRRRDNVDKMALLKKNTSELQTEENEM